MGPAPGIRWKSGAPPAPPKYTADAKEVGSFDRYSRRVRLWAKRASGWMTDGDAALLLVESLSGAAERELEFTPLVEIENGGVEFVLQQLEASSNEHLVYRKHHYLRQWETVRRKVGETMRAYIHRFDQLHKQLSHIDVDVKATYSGEALGHRLLERAGLSTEQARMVLIGSGQSFAYPSIRDSLLLQYPDTLPVPAIGSGPGKEKGKGDKKGAKQVHVASHEEGGEEPPEAEDDDKEVAEITAAIDVLTVTAQKLKNITQGRRWTDGKGTSKDGDKGSTSTSKGKPSFSTKGKGKGKSKGDTGKNTSRVNVCETAQDEGDADDGWEEANDGDDHYDNEEQEDDQYESFFVFMTSHEDTSVVNPSPQVSQVLAVAPQSAAGLIDHRHSMSKDLCWPRDIPCPLRHPKVFRPAVSVDA